jgi:Domain of unknown function (DUF4485)
MSRDTIIDKELDEELIRVTLFVQSIYENKFDRQDQIRIENWITKLAKITYNHEWKKRRNEYICVMAEQVDRGYLSAPFDKSPPDGNIPSLGPGSTRNRNMNSKVSNIVRNTDEIAKLLEEQLGQIHLEDQQVFNLSPRDTDNEYAAKHAKFNTTYDITPSKTNRYKSVRDSAHMSKRDTNMHSSMRAGIQTTPNSDNEE